MKKKQLDFGREILAIILFAVAIFSFICLISYNPQDPAFNSASNLSKINNMGGIVGAYYADFLYTIFGINAFALSLLVLVMATLQFTGKSISLGFRESIASVFLLTFLSGLLHLGFRTFMIGGHEISSGGIIGGIVGEITVRYFNKAGAFLLIGSGFLVSLTILTRFSLARFIELLKQGLWELARATAKVIAFVYSAIIEGMRTILSWTYEKIASGFDELGKKIKEYLAKRKEKQATPVISKKSDEKEKTGKLQPIRKTVETASKVTATATSGPKIIARADEKRRPLSDNQLKLPTFGDGSYSSPAISLLDSSATKNNIKVDEKALRMNATLLEKKLIDFDVEGKVTEIHLGPVITMYEFEPKAGTKVGKIVNLQDDLSLVMGGRSVRVVPHLPGKAALGIEIPNHERDIVWLKDIISSPQFLKSSCKLTLPLGSNIEGKPTVIDLTKMPHLLIAGTTGSGKSVAINSMLISIFYKASPADVRLILVDPKMLELSIYEGVPHLLLPVVTQPKEAVKAMRWAIREMGRRYKIMANAGVRNIIGYNEKLKNGELKVVSEEESKEIIAKDLNAIVHTTTLPYIVIVIDELADLMMTASQEMETTITRLAQMARASGIHLILATQRPSVDVITGLIKANFPARISFKVSSRHDSRTILDTMGSEALLGKGDMLYMSPVGGGLMRYHGTYVSDKEISRVVEHVKQQGKPIYNEDILKEPDPVEGALGEEDEIDDQLYDQAVQIVTNTKQASISMVQRKLRIGYNRAARLIEKMEAQGVVGPADGSKPRQVLVSEL
ncbi:MAG: DNA translocase FtsK 4TM domain-containing protein [Pseudomonadota bacterium]